MVKELEAKVATLEKELVEALQEKLQLAVAESDEQKDLMGLIKEQQQRCVCAYGP